MLIGILGIQGSRKEHAKILEKLGAEILYVRTPEELAKIDAIVMPGGESTTMGKLMKRNGLGKALKKRLETGMPAYGTCAGAILLAKKIVSEEKAAGLEMMDVEISRNAYGSQLDSFIAELNVDRFGGQPLEAVFIRAPQIKKVSKEVEVLAEYDGSAVLLQQGKILISMFHPELTEDTRVHEYFLSLANGAK